MTVKRGAAAGRIGRLNGIGQLVVVLAPLCVASSGAAAPEKNKDKPPTSRAAAKEDPSLVAARERFRNGVELVKQAKWSEALEAFTASRALRPHAVTTFNIGACERALGRYTRARQALQSALDEERANPGQLTEDVKTDLSAFLLEIERLLGHLDMLVTPDGSMLAVDGRPLALVPAEGTVEFVGGLAAPSPGEQAPAGRFHVVLDPGAHVFVFRRKGYSDAVVRRSLAPGEKATLDVRLERLPASIKIEANVPDSLVWVNGADVGPVPVSLFRPPGRHEVIVRRRGYEPYTARVVAEPGEAIQLAAKLEPEKPTIFSRWWFWTGAVAVIGAATFATFALTREDKPPPPYDGGSANWVAFPNGAPSR